MLSDGRVLYVPGVGQWDGKDWTYEPPDGLGRLALSEAEGVRQLADDAAQVTLAQGYMPYGGVGESDPDSRQTGLSHV